MSRIRVTLPLHQREAWIRQRYWLRAAMCNLVYGFRLHPKIRLNQDTFCIIMN